MQGFDAPGRDVETVLKTIIALGRELHMRVTVEGVETEQQVAFLDGVDADQVQVFFFGLPVSDSEFDIGLLKNFQKSLPAQSPASPHDTRPRVVKSAT